MKSVDVLIVGGGVIGLSIAFALAKRGVHTTILDRDAMGQGASWAGAGLLPPFLDRQRSSPMVNLRSWSAQLYREWSVELQDLTGIDNGYQLTGSIEIALKQSEFPDLKTAAGRWRVEGVRFEQLDQKELSSFEPALSPETLLAYFLPDRAQIRNPWHLRALIAACSNLGVTLLPHTPVLGFRRNDERILSVRTAVAEFQPGLVVMAAGAWSGGLLKTANLQIPTPPLKGQLVLFEHEKTLLRRIIEHGKMYLVPRGDGRILMGATEEDTGFDNTPNLNAENQLITHALKICPALKTANAQRTWSGLRPGSLDTRPYLGHSATCRNLLIATGHKRAGLQLAPATAEVIANLVTGEPAGIELKDFAPDRPQPGR